MNKSNLSQHIKKLLRLVNQSHDLAVYSGSKTAHLANTISTYRETAVFPTGQELKIDLLPLMFVGMFRFLRHNRWKGGNDGE